MPELHLLLQAAIGPASRCGRPNQSSAVSCLGLLRTMRKNRLLPLCTLFGVLLCGLTPELHAQPAPESADLILLIDGSENVGAANFPSIRDLALRVVEGLAVDRDTIRVALLLYGADPQIQFYLNSYDNKEAVLSAIGRLNFPGGYESNLGSALEEVSESLTGPEAGGRAEEGVPQILVIISAGQSTDDVGPGERAIKQANIYTFGVAIGETPRVQLEAIASDKSFVLSAPDATTVATMGNQLLPYILGVAQRTIVLETEFTEALAVGKRDIVFLIDSTMGATLVNAVREFIKRFIDSMPIGPDEVQVGVAMFSNTPRTEIDLNSYSSKDALSSALARIKPKPSPDVNIGAALDFVRTNMLTPDKGSRMHDGVPQLVLLIASKKSKDSVQQPAEALQRMGVLTLAAGSRAAEEAELKQIAFDESLVYMLKDFRILLRNPKLLVSPLSTLSGVVVTEGPTDPVVEIVTVPAQKIVRDIVFLVDGSDYVGSANMPAVQNFISSIVNRLDVRPERVRIGLLQFAEGQRTEFYLNSYNSKQDVLSSVASLRPMGGRALNVGAALEFALSNHFQTNAGSRKTQGVQQVLVLITGGPSQDEFKTAADNIAVAGVVTFAVGVGAVDEVDLRTIAFVPNLAYYTRSFGDLQTIAEQEEFLSLLITVVGDTENTSPPEPTTGQRDVAFLIDGSDDIRADFPYVRDFILKVITPLDIGIDKVRIAVVQHSDRPSPNFYLNTYQTKDEVMRAVSGLSPAGGRTLNTGAALTFMKNTIMTPARGSRAPENVPQFLIVLTGGRSRDSVKEPAGALKTDGVVPFGVGVKNADPKQIAAISHNPSFAFTVKEFSELGTVQEKLNSYVSLPQKDLVVFLEQAHDIAKDVVFLLDDSEGTRDGFQAVVDFVQRVVEELNVEESKDRVSVVQYSDDAKVNFYLNSHSRKDAVLNAIKGLRHKGGSASNTGAALQFLRHNVFTSSSGSRRLQGVPQILILLSSRPSSDEVKGPAMTLKDLEIVSVTVGIGNTDATELITISSNPSFTYQVAGFNDLSIIKPQLVTTLKRVSKNADEFETTEISDPIGSIKRDIVFLLDGSDDSRNGFPAIREFIRRMVEGLDVGEDKVRVAVIQYSEDTVTHFQLNTYSNKKPLIHAVRSLTSKGGKILNTGAALQYVRDSVFTSASGSRYQEGVPQLLILMTGRASDDDVAGPAEGLKTRGILSFAIGMKNAIERELNIELDATQRDIVFLLDGSDSTRDGFPAIQQFVQNVVETLNVGQSKDRVSVVQYSSQPEVSFLLSTHSTKQDVLNSVMSLQHQGGAPLNTGAALDYVKNNVFITSSGSRHNEGVPQILVVVAGGRSQDDVRGPSLALKQNNIVPFTVGTQNADIIQLQMIAHTPSDTFIIPQFDDLQSIRQRLVSYVKRVPRQPKRHQSTVTDFRALENMYDKVTSAVAVGQEISVESPSVVQRLSPKRDIVFLIDGSDDARNRFTAIRDFVASLVEALDVGQGKDQIALVQFSNSAVDDFKLNTHTSTTDVVNAIRRLRPKGGRPQYIGRALQFVKDNVLSPVGGGRQEEGANQIVVLLSSGRSRDSPRGPASLLKNMGVKIFSIGSRLTDPVEMEAISSQADYAYSLSDFMNLKNIKQSLITKIAHMKLQEETTSGGKEYQLAIFVT
ncbi:collagen alpha-3(VI) chain [Chanos chanos]|uniref:Collagen alpha-3(VI) chain n=1 Tax=Chanos chanos TaxID=29144 RepID=A0A6J2WDT2_CHACN|nr:collagen alpha-3(VI) chain [Chanos chanos]